MRVIPIATTSFMYDQAHIYAGYQSHAASGDLVMHADELAEFAGRNCYQAWERKNPATATNEGYLDNIIKQGHFSVLEHASISFYVDGVSRALLTELERHRFLSFSVISQRYVDAADMANVTPPAVKDLPGIVQAMNDHYAESIWLYETVVEDLQVNHSFPRKQAREAARAVLPNATEVKMVVTGNVRCWRDVLGKRYDTHADAEIREFAKEILRHLRDFAPNSVQDFPDEPFGDR